MTNGQILLEWYWANARDLPWRRTKDPYAVWVSEAMLQQTQVVTVSPYYARWMERFPTVEDLAASHLDEALAIWQGLGYYRRCRHLHSGARWVVEHGMPQTRDDWKKVPGVGDYTSAAIASICFGEPVAVVDGNVERVCARQTATQATGSALRREAARWAQGILCPQHPGDLNQALMELGATVCKPSNPQCDYCAIQASCLAKQSGSQQKFPKKEAARSVQRIQKHFVIYREHDRIAMIRLSKDQWAEGLWAFPEGPAAAGDRPLGSFRYQVTHHRIHATASVREGPYEGVATMMLEVDIDQAPLPAPQRRIWEAYKRLQRA